MRVYMTILLNLIVVNAAKLVEIGTLNEQWQHDQKEEECAKNGDAWCGALASPRDTDGKAREKPCVQHQQDEPREYEFFNCVHVALTAPPNVSIDETRTGNHDEQPKQDQHNAQDQLRLFKAVYILVPSLARRLNTLH